MIWDKARGADEASKDRAKMQDDMKNESPPALRQKGWNWWRWRDLNPRPKRIHLYVYMFSHIYLELSSGTAD